MDDIFDHCKFVLEAAWYNARYELSGHITLVVVTAAVLILLWIFLAPGVKHQGH